MFAFFTDTSLIMLAGKCCISEVNLSKNEYCKKFDDAIFCDAKIFRRKTRTCLPLMQKEKRQSVPVTGPVVAQRVCRGIALLFHDRGTRSWWVVSSTPRPYFTPGKDPVPIPIVQEAGWAPGTVWRGGKSRSTGIRSPDRPARCSVAKPTELPGRPSVYVVTQNVPEVDEPKVLLERDNYTVSFSLSVRLLLSLLKLRNTERSIVTLEPINYLYWHLAPLIWG